MAVGAVSVALAVLPIAADTLSFGKHAGAAFAENPGTSIKPTMFRHLLRHLPVYEGDGLWFRNDYRYPRVARGRPEAHTYAVDHRQRDADRRRGTGRAWQTRIAAVLALMPTVEVYLVAAPRRSPRGREVLVVLAPMLMFAMAMGAWWLSRRSRVAALVAAPLLAGRRRGVDAIAYRHAWLAPIDRLLAVCDAAEHAPRPTGACSCRRVGARE